MPGFALVSLSPGTLILVLVGNGAMAQAVLSLNTKGNFFSVNFGSVSIKCRMTVRVHHRSLVTRKPCVYLFRPPPLVRRADPQSEQSGGEEKTFGTKTDSQVPQILEICLFHGGFTPEGNININTPINYSPVAVSLSRWAIGMFLGSLVSGGVSGGHLNPSVTVSLH